MRTTTTEMHPTCAQSHDNPEYRFSAMHPVHAEIPGSPSSSSWQFALSLESALKTYCHFRNSFQQATPPAPPRQHYFRAIRPVIGGIFSRAVGTRSMVTSSLLSSVSSGSSPKCSVKSSASSSFCHHVRPLRQKKKKNKNWHHVSSALFPVFPILHELSVDAELSTPFQFLFRQQVHRATSKGGLEALTCD